MIFAWVAQALRGHWWAVCGSASMGIMLMHKFLVVLLEMKVPLVRQVLDMGFIGAFFGSSMLVVCITVLCYGLTLIVKSMIPWALGER